MAISVPPKGEADKKIGAHMAPLSVTAQDTPNMTVKIRAGWFYNTNGDAMEYSGGNSPTITPPGANAKWVIVAINNSASIVLINGTAAASPVLPALTEGHMPLAFVYVPSTATSLGNDKVFDARPVLRGLDIVPNLDDELADRPTFTDMNNALALKADNSGTVDYAFYLNNADAPAADAMYMVKRGASADVGLRWNETADKWQFTNDGTTWVDIASVSGTFMPLVPLAVSGNVATFNGVGEVEDSGVAVGDFATDAEVTAAVAAHAADFVLHLTAAQNTLLDGLAVTLTSAELNFVDGVTSPIQTQLDSKATDALVVHLAGIETITGVKTFTAQPVFQAGAEFESATDSYINFTKGATDDAGFHVDRGVDPYALIEWDETTDQWVAGVNGLAFPILTAANIALDDLTDVTAPAPSAGDVLRFVGGVWVNDPLTDFATDADVAAGYQPLDADLTAVAAIAAGDGFVQRTAGVWSAAALTGTQVNTALGYTAKNFLDSVVTVTFAMSPYAVAATNEVVLVDASGGAVTVDLPAAASGRRVAVKKIDVSANAVTVDANADTIDGATTYPLASQYDSIVAVADGSDWFVF